MIERGRCTQVIRRFGPSAKPIRLVVGGVLLAAVAVSGAARGEERARHGMRVVRDPQSGALIVPPAERMANDAAAMAVGSTAELVVEPVEGPAGGVKIDLRGRARAAVTRQAGDPSSAWHECIELPVAPR